MPDSAPIPNAAATPTSATGGGAGGISRKVMGLPLWGWGVALVGGVAIWYLFLRNKSAGATGSQTSGDTGTSQGGLPDTIDPITGVPYSVEGSINPQTGLPAYYGTGVGYTGQGSTVGSTIGGILPPVTNPPQPQPGLPPPPPGPTGPPSPPNPIPTPTGGGGPQPPPPPQTQPVFVHPSAWPNTGSSISSLARQYGTTVTAIESFPENQYINTRRVPGSSLTGWDLIYTSDTIRVR